MKRLFLLLTTLLGSMAVMAQDLRCTTDLDTLKNIQEQEKTIFEKGTFADLLNHRQKYDYSFKFKPNHGGQSFLFNRWVPDAEYTTEIKSIFLYARNIPREKYVSTFGTPYANFILNQQEICLIPSVFTYQIENNKKQVEENTIIWIRDLNSTDWKELTYEEQMNQKDFREFFPHFPSNIKFRKNKLYILEGK